MASADSVAATKRRLTADFEVDRATKLAGVLKKSATTRTDPITEADKELAAACDRVNELGDMWAQDQITRAEFLRLGKPIRDRADAAQRRLNSLVKGTAGPVRGQVRAVPYGRPGWR